MSEEGFDLSAAWAKVRPVDRCVYGLVVVLIGFAVFGQPIWLQVDSQLALSLAHHEQGDATRDRWGRPLVSDSSGPEGGWRFRGPAGSTVHAFWSVGPNGVDEGGYGDDVPILTRGHPREEIYRALPLILILLSLALAGGRAFVFFLLRPRKALREELGLVAALSLPGGALLGGVGIVLSLLLDGPGSPVQNLRQQLVIPLPIALIGSAYACSFLFVLWIRLSRPPEGAEGDGLATMESPKGNEGSGR